MQHMLHERNYLEIIEKLRMKPMYIRELAKELNLIPSTIMRMTNKLEANNVVDFKTEGKNKVFFLKSSPEAQTHLYMAEYYKLFKILKNPKIRYIVKKIQEKTNSELIILFGSYAKGTQVKESDIDIYVETDSNKLKEDIMMISSDLSVKIGTFGKDSYLGKEIIKDHIIIQNVERFYHILR